ncbi:Oidioi.mRNA.OKI2018_I69.PAR.g13115.t1.cds [Oikopleura dioica]|uniref:Oidioi.mRNA.OKI2018_I69.PAR.g13115.t1.cds n=1 Tax=Oikopleura dioica TaxID=34765 RepID=A0ABN7S370_OIKDI|nr:Oidioi.mRNA.OKI2018_I69.PAR.g13115.t1.cds [Oikopleura dioica]
MKVVLVKDDLAVKDSVSLGISVGMLEDPPDMKGMAHFLEHMVSRSSKNYPEILGYKNFVYSNGGRNNALTSLKRTLFFFDVLPGEAVLEGADRLADFIKSPKLDESLITQEIDAVNSEWLGRRQADRFKEYAVFFKLSNPKHQLSSVFIGNEESLRQNQTDAEIAQKLRKFHESYYSSNGMALVISSKNISLDTMENAVLHSFADLPDLNLPDPIFYLAFRKRDLGKIARIERISSEHKMSLIFQVQPRETDKKISPRTYITSLINEKGPKSLFQKLETEGFIDGLKANTKDYAPGIAFLLIDLRFTDKGLDFWEDVLALTFEYIEMLKRNPPSSRYWNEIVLREKLKYHSKEHVSDVSFARGIVEDLFDGKNPSFLLSGPSENDKFDRKLLKKLIQELHPRNLLISIISKLSKAKQIVSTKKAKLTTVGCAAVNSEWLGRRQADRFKEYAVFFKLSNPKHQLSSVFIGNEESLRQNQTDAEIAQKLRKFHESYYSSNGMALVISSKNISLDTMENAVLHSFADLPDLNLPDPIFYLAFRKRDLGKIARIERISSEHKMSLIFQVQPRETDKKISPRTYITSLINEKGPKSLFQKLETEGFIDGLKANTKDYAPGIAFLLIDLRFTDKGLDFWEDVLALTFEYIEMLKRNPPSSRYWNEIVLREKLKYHSKEHVSDVSFARGIVEDLLMEKSKFSSFGTFGK